MTCDSALRHDTRKKMYFSSVHIFLFFPLSNVPVCMVPRSVASIYLLHTSPHDCCFLHDRLELQHGFCLPVPQLEGVRGCVRAAVRLCSGGAHFYAWEPSLLPGGKRHIHTHARTHLLYSTAIFTPNGGIDDFHRNQRAEKKTLDCDAREFVRFCHKKEPATCVTSMLPFLTGCYCCKHWSVWYRKKKHLCFWHLRESVNTICTNKKKKARKKNHVNA